MPCPVWPGGPFPDKNYSGWMPREIDRKAFSLDNGLAVIDR